MKEGCGGTCKIRQDGQPLPELLREKMFDDFHREWGQCRNSSKNSNQLFIECLTYVLQPNNCRSLFKIMVFCFFFGQAQFVASRVVRKTPEEIQEEQEKTKKKGREKFRYFFGVSRIEVCRQTFIDTLDITHGLLQSVNKRKTLSGDVAVSKRGKRA